jgi:serine/threonine protein kinase
VGALPESILKQLAKQVLRAVEKMHGDGLVHSNISCSQIVFDRRGKVRLSPGFGHIIKSKNETTSSLDQHYSLIQLMSEGTQNFKNRQNLLKDKFNALMKPQADGQSYSSFKELKKLDMLDLGITLTICATGGLDIVSEEDILKLTQYTDKCCLIHALDSISVTTPGFDLELMGTMLSLRRVFQRISP